MSATPIRRISAAAATPEEVAPGSPYRAKRYLKLKGVSLGYLVDRLGLSPATWSRFLAGERVVPNGRAMIEAVLRDRGIPVPGWLWDPASTEEGSPVELNPALHTENPMMEAQFLSPRAQRGHKLFANPFAPEALADGDGAPRLNDIYLSRAHEAARVAMVHAITQFGFIALYGLPGTGKSLIQKRAFADAADFVHPKSLITITPSNIERRAMGVHHVVMEIIRQLSDEKTARSTNGRDAQLAALLRRRYQERDRVVLFIDEAHDLPAEVLIDLKRLQEVRHGFINLLGIVLAGQLELGAKLNSARNHGLAEVSLRAVQVELLPMSSAGDVRAYLASRLALVGDVGLGEVFEPEAVDTMERLLGPTKAGDRGQQTPLVINNTAVAAMNCAHARWGEGVRVKAEDVTAVLAASAFDRQRWGAA